MSNTKKMICPACGAELRENAAHCDYCGSEIAGVAAKQHKDRLKRLENERKALGVTLPRKIINKYTRVIVKAVPVLLLLAAVLCLGAFAIGKVKAGRDKRMEAQHTDRLETLYAAGQLKELSEYISEHDLYGYQYEKYYEVARVYGSYYVWAYDNWQSFNEHKPTDDAAIRQGELYWVLYPALTGMRFAKEWYTDKGIQGNEELLKDLYTEMSGFLEDTLLFTKEEIARMESLEEYNEETLKQYAAVADTRLEAQEQ